MNRVDEINIELFFQLLKLKDNLNQIIDNCDSHLELISDHKQHFKDKIKVLKKEIDNTKKDLEFANNELKKVLIDMSIEALDEVIKKAEPDLINYLLDLRNLKNQ